MKALLTNSIIYFILVFSVGFILGTFRVLWLLPLLGERYAELLEMPFMLIAIYLFARYINSRIISLSGTAHLLIGLTALLLLLSVEFTLVLGIRGISFTEYWQSRDTVSGTFYILSLGLYMLMPYLLFRYSKKL
ncbi:hypothetical protein [Sulfurimonas sp. HSL3-2]|uniref:hypothetical protein n=1 Tax=Hydrocurvibacter mobilis TaxID=3131936 RepID=UPI0031F94E1C